MNPFDVSIPLAAALLCVDCDAICYAQLVCPHCAGTHFLNLASVLNRKPTLSEVPADYEDITHQQQCDLRYRPAGTGYGCTCHDRSEESERALSLTLEALKIAPRHQVFARQRDDLGH